jgi:hypothetical protein
MPEPVRSASQMACACALAVDEPPDDATAEADADAAHTLPLSAAWRRSRAPACVGVEAAAAQIVQHGRHTRARTHACSARPMRAAA